jgi:hypothetical protein
MKLERSTPSVRRGGNRTLSKADRLRTRGPQRSGGRLGGDTSIAGAGSATWRRRILLCRRHLLRPGPEVAIETYPFETTRRQSSRDRIMRTRSWRLEEAPAAPMPRRGDRARGIRKLQTWSALPPAGAALATTADTSSSKGSSRIPDSTGARTGRTMPRRKAG